MSIAVANPPSQPTVGQPPIRVMVVDDAVVVRGLISRWVEAETGLQVVASLRSGREAIEQVERADPDVVILDVDMPDTDGITALPRLLAKKRDLVVIMASTLTRRNAEISLRALALGAADYVPKPETTREITTSTSFRRELIDKIRALGARRRAPDRAARAIRRRLRRPRARASARRSRRAACPCAEPRARARPARPQAASVPATAAARAPDRLLDRRTAGAQRAGRPAQRGDRRCPGAAGPAHAADLHHHPRRASVARQRPHCARGRAWRAGARRRDLHRARRQAHAGGAPRQRARRSRSTTARWSISASRRSIRMFSSAAEVWGPKCLAVVLTGMGSDGTRGAAAIVAAGGAVIAQDEASSVVWGMPGSVTNAGLCSSVLPLDQIAPKVVRLFSGARV